MSQEIQTGLCKSFFFLKKKKKHCGEPRVKGACQKCAGYDARCWPLRNAWKYAGTGCGEINPMHTALLLSSQ